MLVRPLDREKRPDGQPGRSTTTILTDQTSIEPIVADDGDRILVDLDHHRIRRLLIDLGLVPTAEEPCLGRCRRYGTPIGGECWS
jgi:hypothetical protein